MKAFRIDNVVVIVSSKNRVLWLEDSNGVSQDPLRVRHFQLVVDRMFSTKEEVLGG